MSAIGSQNAVAVQAKAPLPVKRSIQFAALTSLDLLLGRGGDTFDRSAPSSAILRNGLIGCAGQGLAVGAGVLGTSVCVGMHVLTHPFTFTKRSIMRSGEMGAMTLGGMGYTGISGAVGALLGAARQPVSWLRESFQRKAPRAN